MPTQFSSPGNQDALRPALLQAWNQTIEAAYNDLAAFHTNYFTLDPTTINGGQVQGQSWNGAPGEVTSCKGYDIARQMCDWQPTGRQKLQNELCEYLIIYKKDSTKKLRPKRVIMTTELWDYWVTLAKNDPAKTLSAINATLGTNLKYKDVYGHDKPQNLSVADREIKFCTVTAGNGDKPHLVAAGVPDYPTGKVNNQYILFMIHKYNYLQGLFYIYMVGGTPFGVDNGGNIIKASRDAMFYHLNYAFYACLNADTPTFLAAYDAAFEGRKSALADVGVYMKSLNQNAFTHNGQPIPANWIQFSRGMQRLEFGPTDGENIFLDDIMVDFGGKQSKVTGGYQVLQQMEIGASIKVGNPTALNPGDYVLVNPNLPPITCNTAVRCNQIEVIYQDYLNS